MAQIAGRNPGGNSCDRPARVRERCALLAASIFGSRKIRFAEPAELREEETESVLLRSCRSENRDSEEAAQIADEDRRPAACGTRRRQSGRCELPSGKAEIIALPTETVYVWRQTKCAETPS